MRTEVEAPVTEPPHVGDGVAVAGVRKTYGAVVALDGVDLRVRAGEVVAVVGPERVREVDAAGARVRAWRHRTPARSTRRPPR